MGIEDGKPVNGYREYDSYNTGEKQHCVIYLAYSAVFGCSYNIFGQELWVALFLARMSVDLDIPVNSVTCL